MTKSPTIRLLLGLLVTLAAVTGFSSYSLYQLQKLRQLQTQTIDLNRHDSLLLLRVQSDVNTLGLKLQDMTERPDARGISEYREQFDQLRADLEDALSAEAKLAPGGRQTAIQGDLQEAVQRFWTIADKVFKAASAGHETRARRLASGQLSDQQIVVARRLAAILERNNQAEERADVKIASIYDRAEKDTYVFLTATMVAIVVTSLYLIYSNRQLFDQLQSLSRQRRVLAARLISVQEEVLRSVSRELHDEFGQILTAVGAMLARAERKGVPPDSPLRTELSEVREITHATLEKMRSLSQALHPSILDDYGLAKGIEWYAGVFERQAGIKTTAVIRGDPIPITGAPATHCFRIVQEALNNAAKHSGTKFAEVEMIFSSDVLTINIRDFGSGMSQTKKAGRPGLGLIAMRERAEILFGELKVSSAPDVGTTITLVVPLRRDERLDSADSEEMGEVITRTHE
ncbi:MAG: sensor histidine kinase [Acidobacteriaceae bacterium]|nr:sensor histidine kinase [Acidobacteriaceae bacterium]